MATVPAGAYANPHRTAAKEPKMDNRQLTIEETLYFYDQPLLFTGRIDGALWAFTLDDNLDNGRSRYSAAPVDAATVAAVDANQLPLSALFPAHAPIHTIEIEHLAAYDEDVIGTIVQMEVCADQEASARACVPDQKVFLHR